jgi:diguanylate cyclase (GGDEF)-like protein
MNSVTSNKQDDKKALLATKRQMLSLSGFVVKLTHFYQGVVSPLDQEFKVLRTKLNKNTEFGSTEESMGKLAGLMMELAETLKSQNQQSKDLLMSSIGQLQNNPMVSDALGQKISETLEVITSSKASYFESLPYFGQILNLYQQLINDLEGSPSIVVEDKTKQAESHQDLIDELSALVGTLIQNDAKDKELPQIRAQLLDRLDQDTLLDCCKKVISAISKNVGAERRHNEKFVLNLQSSLSDVNEKVSDSLEDFESTFVNKEQKNELLQEHIEGIENVVDKSDDLQQLKAQASDYLEKMAATLSDRKQSDQDEQLVLMTLLNDMQSQISSLEKDTANYKKRLVEQKHRSNNDPLTKIPNRIAYNQRLELEHKRWLRSKLSLSMAVLDVDHFKNINDTYGHAAGDKTLQVIAQTISKTLRATDFLARWGGEEFIILLPDTDASGVSAILEKIRGKIESIPFKFKDAKVTITISIGGAKFDKDDNPATVFERADKNLYEAKNTGRNRTVLK